MKKVPEKRRYYERIPGETHKAWLAFCVYRDIGPSRSLDKAYRSAIGKEGRHARHCATWSKNNRWVSRAAAYDTAMLKRQRRAVVEDRIDAYWAKFTEFW